MHRSELPAELQKALESSLRYGNPMGKSPRRRAAWVATAGVPIRILKQDPRPAEVLWFVECYPSYHPRGQDNARATADGSPVGTSRPVTPSSTISSGP